MSLMFEKIYRRVFYEWSKTWWHDQMETFSALLALCVGNSPVIGEVPPTKASDAEPWCFFLSVPEQMVERTIETPVIWDTTATMLIMTSL